MQSACFAFQESIFNNCSEYEGGAFFRLECCRGNVIFLDFLNFQKHTTIQFLHFCAFFLRFLWTDLCGYAGSQLEAGFSFELEAILLATGKPLPGPGGSSLF